jgi:hypothetical protein
MDTIIHIDIETLGKLSGVHPMIAIGAAAFIGDKEVASFHESISWEEGDLGLTVDSETVEWWQQFPEQLEAIMKTGRPVERVMREFVDWVLALPGERKVFAAWPPIFDVPFMKWYIAKFCPYEYRTDLFNYFHTMDIKSYLAAYFNVPYSKAGRILVPDAWVKDVRVTHNPLDDARWQAAVLNQILGVN